MKPKFEDAARSSSRKIVMHEACFLEEKEVLNRLKCNDILFCDDCLYSQYVFLKHSMPQLQFKKIICVIGFSTSIFREAGAVPIYEAKCSECHDMFHRGLLSAKHAYMSISEIKELLAFDNIYLAAHGDQHLQLENSNCTHLQKSQLFKHDIEKMHSKLESFGFNTNIFVFPYAYDCVFLAYKILEAYGYTTFFAGLHSRRIPIENIQLNNVFE